MQRRFDPLHAVLLIGLVGAVAFAVRAGGSPVEGDVAAPASTQPADAPPEPDRDATPAPRTEEGAADDVGSQPDGSDPDGVLEEQDADSDFGVSGGADVESADGEMQSELPFVPYEDLEGVPGPDTTGVRDGVPLREVESLVVTEDGAVVERVRSTTPIRIKADDVTLRDVEIVYAGDAFAVQVQRGYERLTVEHSTIELRANDEGRVPGAGIFSGPGTVVRNTEIRGVSDGIKAASGSTYEGNWIHLERAPGSGKHLDAIQNAADDLVIRGNLLDVRPDLGGNAAYIATVQSEELPNGLLIEGNVLSGGNYALFVGGDDGCLGDVRIVDNVFVDGSRYGQVSHGDCPIVFTGNRRTAR